jgi:hypothetical protein
MVTKNLYQAVGDFRTGKSSLLEKHYFKITGLAVDASEIDNAKKNLGQIIFYQNL